MGWAGLAALILTEVPQFIDLLNEMKANNQTEATADQLARLGLADDKFAGAYQRLFGVAPPTA